MTPPADPMLGRLVGPYRLVSPLGAGGMGTVYLAERVDEIRRRVAVKLIRGGLASQEALYRFHLERQTLAALEHPNIVRLLDGGTTPEGLPYVVMDYVPGEPIDVWCARRGLGVDARVRLFLSVCAAVQYAHQRLIVHRDLKPANLLVTAEGTVKLLDFGIAKLLVPGADITQAGAGPMTPRYASPEQLRGETITTASDIYALGVLLFELLTGRSPYRVETDTAAAWVHSVLTADPPRPGLGDLDDILAVALRKEPAARYPSAWHLAEDLRRYLEGRPVLARRGTWRYRAAKFIRRNRAAVATATLLALAAALGAGAALWQAGVAQVERARSERRFNDVRRLVNIMLVELHEAAAKIPGSTALQELIVKRSLEYLDSLARDSAGDLALSADLAEAYVKFGDIQGNPYENNLGDTPGALASYGKALELARAVARARSGDPTPLRALARVHSHTADVLAVSGKLAEAVDRMREAIGILEPLAASRPKDLAARMDFASVLESLGDKLGNPGLDSLGDTQGALAAYRRSLEQWQAAASLDPRNPRCQRASATLHMKLADLLEASGDGRAAQREYRQALAMIEAGGEAGSVAAQRLAGTIQRKLGVSLAESGDTRAGVAAMEAAAGILAALAAADPADQRARSDLALVWLSAGDLHYRAGELAPAIAALSKAAGELEALAKLDPANRARRQQHAYALLRTGAVLHAAGQSGEARRQTARALAMVKESADRPEAAAAELERAARYFMGCEPAEMRRPAEALRYARRAAELTNFSDPAYLATLAEAQAEAGDRAAARSTAAQALALVPAGSAQRAELESRLAPLGK